MACKTIMIDIYPGKRISITS